MNGSVDAALGLLHEAWSRYGDPRTIAQAVETSPGVSTNRVFRLSLNDGSTRFAKLSSYGSYVHFRQDHQRIRDWMGLLCGTRFEAFLAPVLEKEGDVFTFQGRDAWVVLYDEAPRRAPLPKVLEPSQIVNLAEEVAAFHAASERGGRTLPPTWQTLGSDIAQLYDQLRARERPAFARDAATARYLLAECDRFLTNVDRLGYHRLPKLPVLIDWNRGNFSVSYDEQGRFTLFGRWDYDWFRIEPRIFDFYFFSRVVRDEGDQTFFNYMPDPLFEPRFGTFLRAYHRVQPIAPEELLLMAEAYRFFILNYVLRRGQHFFQPALYERLAHEACARYLPALAAFDFHRLGAFLDHA